MDHEAILQYLNSVDIKTFALRDNNPMKMITICKELDNYKQLILRECIVRVLIILD